MCALGQWSCWRLVVLLALAWPPVGQSADAVRAPDDDSEIDAIVVTATRTSTFIRDEPLRVEAVPAEEIEENLTVQPGNLTSLLKELPGVRMQSIATGLAGAAVQLRGMPGRHTLVLADGLPLLGAETDAFGLLQTPPLDLVRVEVIKGVASALYGSGALGGVLNLVSATPDAESSILANATSRGGRDLVCFLSGKGSSRWSGTLTAGAHYQSREDVDGDGWSDLAGFHRFTLRPRVWWDAGQSRSVLLTAGVVDETRDGGSLPGRVLPDGSSFLEALRTRRFDAGAVVHWALTDARSFTGRVAVTSTRFDRTFATQRIPSIQTTAFAEGAWTATTGGHTWVLGLAFEHAGLAVAAVPGVGYTYNVPAAFAQDEFSPTPWVTLAGSVRVDAQSDYGTFVSPRLSALLRRPGSEWSLRASVGGGFAAPTPFIDEIEATGLGTLLPLRGLHAERAATAALDAKWSDGGWDLNASVFVSEIGDPLEVRAVSANHLELTNAPGPRRAPGAEVLIGYTRGPLHLLTSWSYLHVTEAPSTGIRQDAPLVPRHSASLDAIFESETRGRIGFELEYTGRQALADNPYRDVSRSYFQLNALAEIRFGGVAVFLNAINLTDVRQTHYDPLLLPTPGLGGVRTTDVWAPLAGRTFNLGIRAEL